MKPGRCKRPIILATDHFSHPPLRTDYTVFQNEHVTAQMRKWVRNLREKRGNKR